MAGRRWTVLVVPQGAGASREFHISAFALRTFLGFGTAVAAGLVVLTYIAVAKSVDLSRLDRLERRNEILAAEIVQMNQVVTVLSDTMSAISERDRNVRLLAGLEPRDPAVAQAGIGGPLGPLTEADLLLSETALGRNTLSMRSELSALNRRARFLASSFQEAVVSLSDHVDRLERTPSIFPVEGFVSSEFSQRRIHPIYQVPRPHEGIDVVAERGTPIVAAAAGRVVGVGRMVGYGLVVTVDHGDGVRTRYAHCSETLVRVGQRVQRGEDIALVGRTGTATNDHLHYEVIVNGRQVDPRTYIFNKTVVD